MTAGQKTSIKAAPLHDFSLAGYERLRDDVCIVKAAHQLAVGGEEQGLPSRQYVGPLVGQLTGFLVQVG